MRRTHRQQKDPMHRAYRIKRREQDLFKYLFRNNRAFGRNYNPEE